MIRNARTFVHMILAVVGTVVVLGQAIWMLLLSLATQPKDAILGAQIQFVVVVMGLMLMQASLWKLANRFLPERRTFLELRYEADVFIGMVRELNASRLENNEERVEELTELMHSQIGRIVNAAGKETVKGQEPAGANQPADAPST